MHSLVCRGQQQFRFCRGFHIDCGLQIFSEWEILNLRKWGNWYSGLSEGKLTPFTVAQQHFVRAIRDVELLSTREEWAWFKYLKQRKREDDNRRALLKDPLVSQNALTVPCDSFLPPQVPSTPIQPTSGVFPPLPRT